MRGGNISQIVCYSQGGVGHERTVAKVIGYRESLICKGVGQTELILKKKKVSQEPYRGPSSNTHEIVDASMSFESFEYR